MSEQHDGGPAFPVAENHAVAADIGWTCGISVRDYFAAAAFPRLLGAVFIPSGDDAYESTAREAYRLADAMLRARRQA